MQVVSVNIGSARPVGNDRRATVSGIDKRPSDQPVFVGANGLRDDTICNTTYHGGPDQAVYVYGAADYAWWSEQLGRDISPGTFGDNLTIDGLPPDLNAGDRLQIGELLLEAAAPRIPCETLAAQMGDRKFGLTFRRGGEARFLFPRPERRRSGRGPAGHAGADRARVVSMLDLFRLAYELHPAVGDLQRALAAPLATRMREKFENKLRSTA